MSLIFIQNVKNISQTTGTGPYTYGVTFPGFTSFSTVTIGDTFYYAVTNGSDFEFGLGQAAASNQILRNSVTFSSNSNAAVNWPVGSKIIYLLQFSNSALYGGLLAFNAPSGVTAGTYGNSGNVGQFVVDKFGRITTATNVAITGVSPGSIALTNTHVLVGNASNVATDVAMTGDATIANTGALTFATVNANVGSFGSASTVPVFTTNAKGLITGVNNTGIQIAESQVTNLVSDLAAKQTNTLASGDIWVGNGSNIATAVIMSGDATLSNTGVITLATVASALTKGSASKTVTQTINAKGLTTSLIDQDILITESQVTNLVTDLAAKQSTTLTSAHILVGNVSNLATDVAVSGGVSMTNAGVFTVLTNANLTGPITSIGNATSIASQTGTGSTFAMSVSPAFTGSPTAPTPAVNDNSTLIPTTAFVNTAIANALTTSNPAVECYAATTSASDTSGMTYSNGVSGIGATLTGTANTPFVLDGQTFTALNQKALIKNDTQSPSGARNGIYYVTQIQTVLLPPILTRALNYDQPSDINNTGVIPVVNGTVNALTGWIITSTVNTVGTDAINYTQFSKNPSTVVTSVGATSPITSTGGTTPVISTSMATNKLIGRGTAGTGVFEEITLGSNLSLSGTTLNVSTGAGGVTSVTGTANRITSSGGTTPIIDIAATYVGQTSITTLGTISAGTWQSIKIGLAYGGTNADLSATGGTSQYLKQASSGAAVTVGTIPASDIASGAALTRTNDTNVTLALGGSAATALLAATSLTLGWTGTLAETRGGTAQSTYALGDTLYSSATNTLAKLAGNITTTKKFLTQTGNGSISAVPGWNTIVAGDIPDLSATYVPYVGATADVNIAAHNFKLTGYISQTTTAEATNIDLRDSTARGTTYGFSSFGLVAGSSSTSIDVEQTNSSTAAGATVDHTVFMDDQTHYAGFGMASKNYNVAGSSSVGAYDAYLYSFADNVGILAYGAGKKVYITAGGGNTANVISDFSAYGLRSYVANQTGYTTIATAAGTTTLTSASTQQQYFTGTLAQTVKLPDTSTIAVGFTYRIRNLSTGLLTVQTSTAAALTAIPQYEVICTCISVAGNTAAAWDLSYMGSQTGSFSVNSTTASTPAASLAVGSISNLSVAPAAATGSGNALTITSSTSKIEAVALAGGVVTMWCENSNMNGAATSPNFAYQFYYNAVANLTETGFTTLSATYNPVGASGFGSIASGQAIELKWRQASGTGQRTTVFAPLIIHWIWRPS